MTKKVAVERERKQLVRDDDMAPDLAHEVAVATVKKRTQAKTKAKKTTAEREEQRKRWRKYYAANKDKYKKWAAAWRAKQKKSKVKKTGPPKAVVKEFERSLKRQELKQEVERREGRTQ